MLPRILAAICLLAAGSTAGTALAQLAASAWPDYGGGYANQHRSPNPGPAASPTVLWTYDYADLSQSTSNYSFHQPILLSDGTIIFSVHRYAIDNVVALAPNGDFLWHKDVYSLGPWTAADQNDRVYTISGGDVRVLNADGSNGWSSSLPGSNPTQNGPALGRDGTAYAAIDHSPLCAFANNGVQSWVSSASSGYYVNPAVGSDGRIYIGGDALTALETDGSVAWTYPTRTQYNHHPKYLSPAIGDDGTIYAGQNRSLPNLVAIAPDGQARWTRPDLDGAPSIGLNGDIYVVPESGILSALDPSDGSTRWTYPTGKTDYYNCEGVTIDFEGNLYLCNEDGLLMSLTSEGQFRWSYDLAPENGGIIEPSAPVIGPGGVLYVAGGYSNRCFALVPEPSSLLLLLAGLLAWIGGRKGAGFLVRQRQAG